MKKECESLSNSVEASLDKFFRMHAGDSPESGLYERVINEVERSLIKKNPATRWWCTSESFKNFRD